MVKPQLPEHINKMFPIDVVKLIYSFVPHLEKVPSPKGSPSLERELRRIQSKFMKGKSSMYMNELEDFVLDHNKHF
jgi:hypothetical protein